MSTAIVTGSYGLVGSAVCELLLGQGYEVIGVDNDQRATLFGLDASTKATGLKAWAMSPRYRHFALDIRDANSIDNLFRDHSKAATLIVHTAAQPSHDWSGLNPFTDFEINCLGTMHLLEAMRTQSPDAMFVFVSTNKVYGDSPNRIKLEEQTFRFSPEKNSKWSQGFSEDLPLDQSTHSPFGVSKAAADLYVQEYGRYFGLRTAVLRPGCLTGVNHAGVKLHGFLSYLVKSLMTTGRYEVIGHRGLQVRDNLDAYDLASAIYQLRDAQVFGDVYNIGGGPVNGISVLEAIRKVEGIAGMTSEISFDDRVRVGDHRWYVTDNRKFESHFPGWSITKGTEQIISEIVESNQGAT